MKRLYFGTDGVRGPYGGPLINETFACRLAEAAGRWWKRREPTGARRVLIGRDTRHSGASLASALAAGFQAAGLEPVLIGIAPTPAVAMAVLREKAALGVMVTASHNPAEDNGIKFFNRDGMKLTDAEEVEIEQLLPAAPAGPTTLAAEQDLAVSGYIAKACTFLSPDALKDWVVVLDTANGATCATSPAVLRHFGARIVSLGAAPTGHNINASCGSEHPEALAAAVRTEHARVGIAHDGDGDRFVLCDETGDVLDGDEILALLAVDALERGELTEQLLVATVQSNLGLDAAVAQAGGRVLRTQVGDRYVLEGMKGSGARLGGESSGHIISLDVSTTGDGLVAALKVLAVMVRTGRPLSELRRVMRKFPQATEAIRVREKKELSSLPGFSRTVRELEGSLGSEGRVLVRYSGTEAKLRLLVEGPTQEVVSKAMIQLLEAARAELDVV